MPAERSGAVKRRRAKRPGPPSPLLLFLPPLLITAGTVGVAAVHAQLGSPLGPAFAAEVWGLAKTFIAASIALSSVGGFVVANNRRAWAAVGGSEHGKEHDDHPSAPVQLPPPPAPRATTGRHPLVTDTMRKRRTGRLTPVTDARDAVAPEPTPRQAGTGGPR